MSLSPGSRLGAYEIVSLLGAGGMGEVYRARDTRLDRTVAIKILPERLSADPDLRERFDREARAVASLNHPNICTLHDVGREGETAFLVMEYLDGETLEERLKKGPFPPEQALRIAIDIADALDKAHRAGIVHRDLKPGNIMLTKSGAKLLDFGLAKAAGPAGPASGLSMLPTTPPNMTAQGAILGTFQYMAPEQLEGEEADARTDIFAFGVVLYQMLTGRPAFAGRTQASLIGAILKDEPPPIHHLPLLDHIVRRCLAKDRDARWQTAGDLTRELRWVADVGVGKAFPAAGSGAPRRARREWIAWAVAAAAVALAIAASTRLYLTPAPAAAPVLRFSVALPEGWVVDEAPGTGPLALSHDGRRLAFVAFQGSGARTLWVRDFGRMDPWQLAGTEGAAQPFWSPDDRSLGFFAGGKLKRIGAGGGGGTPVVLANAADARGGAWGAADVILFAPAVGQPLMRIGAGGGQPAPVTKLAGDDRAHVRPLFLDGHRFLFTAIGREGRSEMAGSLDSAEQTKVMDGAWVPVNRSRDYLLFVQGSTLMARAFDAGRMTVAGDPLPVADNVKVLGPGTTNPVAIFSASESGVIAYQSSLSRSMHQLTWMDRAGRQMATLGDAAQYQSVEMDEAGAHAAVAVLDPVQGTRDIWLFDLASGVRTRFTFSKDEERSAVFSRDGSRVAFNSGPLAAYNLFAKATNGAGAIDTLLSDDHSKDPMSWSPDGRYLLYRESVGRGSNNIWVLPTFGDRKPFPLLNSDANENYGRFSPDGRWIAYESDEAGRSEVYVAPFPATGAKWQISGAGGTLPRWRRDGKELFYVTLENVLTAVDVDGSGAGFQAGASHALFPLHPPLQPGYSYAVSADGQKFLVNTDRSTPAPLTVIMNWTSALRK
jgi:Tol biopolymer transport system component/predicted Ser/Thr protein kinase